MVETELHFFQIKIEVLAAHAVITFQLGLCITPEVLNAVNVVAMADGETLLMIDAVVLKAVEHQPIVRAKAVSVDDAFRDDFCLDDLAQSLARDIFDNARIDFAMAL